MPVVLVLALLCVAGCGKFFVPVNGGGGSGGGGGGTSSGNYFYVGNQNTGTIAGFSVGTSNLSNTPNSPYSISLGISPSAIAVTPGGKYIYAGSLGGIFGFSINSNGSLSMLNNGTALVSGVAPATMGIDPSGMWLVEVDVGTSTTAPVAHVFRIDSSSGSLTTQGNPLGLDVGSPNGIAFTPNGDQVFISLGTTGVDIFSFNASTGALFKSNQRLIPKIAQGADQGLAIDPGGKYLFVAETGSGLRVISIPSTPTGALGAEVAGSPFPTGVGPTAVVVDSTGAYAYVTNFGDGTISAFSISSNGVLTNIQGSPFQTGSRPSALAEDTAHTHIGVACAGGSPDFQVFTIGSSTSATPGGLTSFAKTTGTTASGASAVVAAD